MTQVDVKELRALLEKASAGEWGFDERYDGGPCHVWAPSRQLAMDGGPMRYVDCREDIADLRKENSKANAALIVAMKRHLAALLDEVESHRLASPAECDVEAAARLIDAEAFSEQAAEYERSEPVTLWPERRAWARERARAVLALASPAGGGDATLPCDVRLPPATTISAGCKVSTLLGALEDRRGIDPARLRFNTDKRAASPAEPHPIARVGLVGEDIERRARELLAAEVPRSNDGWLPHKVQADQALRAISTALGKARP